MTFLRICLQSFLCLLALMGWLASSAALAQGLTEQIDAIKQAMMADPKQALALAEEVEAKAQAQSKTGAAMARSGIDLATAQWLKGEALLRLNQFEKAAPVVDSALETALSHALETKLHGDILRARGALFAMTGDVENALADFLKANDIFLAADEPRSRAMILQDIGQIYFDAGDYERVLYYYNEAEDAYSQDPWINLSNYNNRAQVYQEQQNFEAAIAQYELALRAAKQLESAFLEARIFTNLAATHVKARNLDAADQAIASAIQLSAREEAAGLMPFINGVHASIARARGDDARAAKLLEKVFQGVALDQTPLPYRDFHELAGQVYEKLGKQALALAHFKAFHRLDAEASGLTASASVQLMNAQFNFANQNLKISNLRQGQLERDILIEKQRADFQLRAFTGIAAASAVIFSLLLFGYISIKRSRDEVRVANDNLSDTNTALEKALEAKTEFLATTSHEIRTPLNGILGMTQVLLADQRLAAETKSRLQVVQGAGQAMKLLVDDILDVAKMETGDVSIVVEDIDLKALLVNVGKLWKSNAEAKSLQFEAKLDALPCTIKTDGHKLQQILSNLLSNAVKFTHEGDVALTADVIDGSNGAQLEFTVTDSGIGIAPADQARIFEPFTQANSSTTREFAGTGLGLAICQRLAEALGGSITLKSALGSGATFTLRLPIEITSRERFSYDPSTQLKATTLKEASLIIVNSKTAIHPKMRALFAPHVRSLAFATTLSDAVEQLNSSKWDHILLEADALDESGAPTFQTLASAVEEVRGLAEQITVMAKVNESLTQTDLEAIEDVQVILKPVSAQHLMSQLQMVYGAAEKMAA